MNGWVVDASVAAKWVFDEAECAHARALIGRGLLSAPDLLLSELVHVAVNKVRFEAVAPELAERSLTVVEATLDVVAPSQAYRTAAFRLAVRHGFSGYDAHYVAMAVQTGRTLVTADRELVRLARRAGFDDAVVTTLDVT